ncbi:MAG: MFS transporter [Proteobacteria bacterium]|nr:MAG: MFS transporter [Pseudomonadota bacterium]
MQSICRSRSTCGNRPFSLPETATRNVLSVFSPMSRSSNALNASERRAVVSLALIFALRMLGLFMILPVLSVFARDMPESTPALAGLAMGIYGLTQAILQIPFGYFSDRVGRKRVITIGLVIFMLGSIVAALADTIYGVIAGRALQGAGAIAAAVLALAADLTREQQRTKATATIGASIGVAFLAALMLAPVLEGWIGVAGIFWITAGLPALMLPVLWWWTPDPVRVRRDADVVFNRALFGRILRHPQLIRFDLGIFALHLSLTSFFVVVPLQLVDTAGLPSNAHWKIYVPVLVLSVVGMLPLLIHAHRKNRYRETMAIAIALMVLAELAFGTLPAGIWTIAGGLWLYFVGFNALEAMLPSLISRVAPAGTKGTVLGVYNTFEFAGIFVGGLLGGWAYGAFGAAGAYLLTAVVLGAWLVLVLTAPNPKLLNSITLVWSSPAGSEADRLLARLTALPGVEDGTAVVAEGLVYLKVDPGSFDPASVDRFENLSLA